jgi:hypothetical protein
VTSPWLSTEEIAVRLRFLRADGSPDLLAARRYLDRAGIPTKRRGRMVLAHVEDVDGSLVTRTERPRMRRVS